MQALPMILMAGSQIAGGIGGLAAGNANNRALNMQADGEIRVGTAEEARIREAAAEAIGNQVAGQWANGMTGGSGSALDAVMESRINAALDALETRRRAQIRATELRAQGKQAKREGRMALLQGFFGAASSAYQAKVDWADARRGQTPMPPAVNSPSPAGTVRSGGYSVATPYGRTSPGVGG